MKLVFGAALLSLLASCKPFFPRADSPKADQVAKIEPQSSVAESEDFSEFPFSSYSTYYHSRTGLSESDDCSDDSVVYTSIHSASSHPILNLFLRFKSWASTPRNAIIAGIIAAVVLAGLAVGIGFLVKYLVDIYQPAMNTIYDFEKRGEDYIHKLEDDAKKSVVEPIKKTEEEVSTFFDKVRIVGIAIAVTVVILAILVAVRNFAKIAYYCSPRAE